MSNRIVIVDSIRGLCLVNIFINHLSSGILHNASPSKLFFLDSADVFVLLAGISSFLSSTRQNTEFPAVRRRLWRRALEIYVYNLVIIVLSLIVLVLAEALLSGAGVASTVLAALRKIAPHQAAWHLLTMQQTVGFSNVLRLYVVLALAAPFYVWLAHKVWWLPPAVAVPIWLVAGHFSIAEHDSLTLTPLALTILPWNLVFACGIAIGAGISNRIELPLSPVPLLLSGSFALFCTFFVTIGIDLWPSAADWAATRNEHFWTGASKTLQSPIRVANLAAVTFLVLALPRLPLMRLFHQAKASDFLPRLGAHSLDVFSFGAVFALIGDSTLVILSHRAGMRPPWLATAEIAIFGAALLLMAGIAGRGRPLLPIRHLWSARNHSGRRQATPADAPAAPGNPILLARES